MVYELLKSERRDDGFTPKEIIDRVSQTYDITAGKALRKQVAVALRRGIDFGIIARKNNKYRFKVFIRVFGEFNEILENMFLHWHCEWSFETNPADSRPALHRP